MQLVASKVQGNTALTKLIRHFRHILHLKTGPWIAGGAARRLYLGEPELGSGDLDIFCPHSKQQMIEDEIRHLDGISWRGGRMAISSYGLKFDGHTYLVQAIPARHKQDETPSIERVFQTFDFNICCFATDGYEIVATTEAIVDVAKRQLRPVEGADTQRGRFPTRLLKYAGYGYTPAPGTLRDLMGPIEEVTPDLCVKFDRQEYYDT